MRVQTGCILRLGKGGGGVPLITQKACDTRPVLMAFPLEITWTHLQSVIVPCHIGLWLCWIAIRQMKKRGRYGHVMESYRTQPNSRPSPTSPILGSLEVQFHWQKAYRLISYNLPYHNHILGYLRQSNVPIGNPLSMEVLRRKSPF